MTSDELRAGTGSTPPISLGVAVQALWWAHRGKWDRAHGCVQQNEGDPDCDLVHAYLHRQEGDLVNAGHWYRSAGRPVATGPLDQEWDEIAAELLIKRS